MNKKGFTLVELLLVIVIISIIGAITIPNILESLDESKSKGGESVEKLLEKNLELYNKDHEKDLWCTSSEQDCTVTDTQKITIQQLYNMNPDINMGDCLLTTEQESLIIRNIGEDNNPKYSYSAEIICSKEFDSSKKKIATEEDRDNPNIYYKSE